MLSPERQSGVIGETPVWLADPRLFVREYRIASVLRKADMLGALSHDVLEADPQVSTFQYYQRIAGFLPRRTREAELLIALKAADSPNWEMRAAGRVVYSFWALHTVLSVITPYETLDEGEKGELVEETISAFVSGEKFLSGNVHNYSAAIHSRVEWRVEKYIEARQRRREADQLFTDTPENESAFDVVFAEASVRERNASITGVVNTALNLSERRVIYGRVVEGKTLKQLGGEIGLTKERIRQIEDRALRKLRSRVHVEHFEVYQGGLKSKDWWVEELNPTPEQIQVVYDCLPEKATVGRLQVSCPALNKITTLGYYFGLKDLLAKTPEELEKEMGRHSSEIAGALKYHIKELFGELLAENAPWAGEKAAEAREQLVVLEFQKLQTKLSVTKS